MTRDEWLRTEFLHTSKVSDDVRQRLLLYKAKYEKLERKRGWRALYIQRVSTEVWTTDLEYDNMNQPETLIRWCEENCEGNWNNISISFWEFELAIDAMAFRLRWGN